MHSRNLTFPPLKPREIQDATITTLYIQKLRDNDKARLFHHGSRTLLNVSMVCIEVVGKSDMVPIHWPQYSPNLSSFEHVGMHLTKEYVGYGPLGNTPPIAKRPLEAVEGCHTRK